MTIYVQKFPEMQEVFLPFSEVYPYPIVLVCIKLYFAFETRTFIFPDRIISVFYSPQGSIDPPFTKLSSSSFCWLSGTTFWPIPPLMWHPHLQFSWDKFKRFSFIEVNYVSSKSAHCTGFLVFLRNH